MSSFSVTGLSSGLDTKSIVKQLIDIDSRPKIRKEWSRTLWEDRKAIWTDVNARILALQGKANVINNGSTWQRSGVTSSQPSNVSATLGGPAPAVGTYTLNVTQLAATERWAAANTTPAATGGARQTGSFYSAAFATATGSTALTSLTDVDGTALGLDAGSTITMSASVNGAPVSASFTVGAGSTLADLTSWAESNFSGASFTVNGDGTLSLQSAPGAANEIDSFSFSAVDSASTPLTVFNGTAGASSSFVAPASGGTAASDTLTITQGASTWNIAIAAGSDDAAIAAAINGTSGIGVTASVVAGRLQVQAPSMGAAGDFTISSAGSLASDLGLAQAVNGSDAIFDVNGTSYTRTQNLDIGDVIADVDIDLTGVTTSAVTLTVENGPANTADIKKKLTEFVDAYNAVVDLVNARTAEKKVVNAKTQAEFVKAPLSRDFGLTSVGFDLRRSLTDTISGMPADFDSLDDIGISTGNASGTFTPQSVSGRLVIDETRLDAALASNPNEVRDLFTRIGAAAGNADDGITRRVSDMASQLRNGGRVDAAIQGAGRQVTDMQRTIERLEDRLEKKREMYTRMFANLETRLGRLQTQNSFVSGQLGQLQQSMFN